MKLFNEIIHRIVALILFSVYSIYRIITDLILWIVYFADVLAYGNGQHLYVYILGKTDEVYKKIFEQKT